MGAIAVHHTPTSDASWDGPANKTRLRLDDSGDYYSAAFAWKDSAADPKLKESYRFIHHFVAAEGDIGAASLVACTAGIGVLNGARGGTTIPDADRAGVYRHLAVHLKDADIEPPELKAAPMELKSIPMQMKAVREDGTFDGIAAVYGNQDLVDDILKPRAFAKSVSDHNGKFPIRDGHDWRIGVAEIKDAEEGLLTTGSLNLGTQAGKDAYSDLKFFHDHGLTMGMSIGFLPIPAQTEYRGDGTRVIHEARLFEVSITDTPVNPLARVFAVKSMTEAQRIDGFDRLLQEFKSGRAISSANAARMLAGIKEFLALLEEAGVDVSEITTPKGAAEKTVEPAAGHSALLTLVYRARQLYTR